MADLLLRNGMLVDGEADRPVGPVDVLVADGRIAEVSSAGSARRRERSTLVSAP